MTDDAADKVQLLCLDVDGVLTDGGIHLDDRGVETKRFHVHDGCAIKIWMKLDYHVAIITSRSSDAVRHRARELGVSHVMQGVADKAAALRTLLDKLDLEGSQAAVVGDDLPDLPMLRLAGYPIAVANAVAEVREPARFVTARPGGHGAVRDAVEHLLKAKNRWPEALALFDLTVDDPASA